MNSEDTIEILIADDRLAANQPPRLLAMTVNQFEEKITSSLKCVVDDFKKHKASFTNVKVTFVNQLPALRKLLAEKKWDFIALDNQWEAAGEAGFDLITQIRKEGLNKGTPFCIFTDQAWLREPHNINRLYELDRDTENVESYADFFPKPQWIEGSDENSWIDSFVIELLVRIKACLHLRILRKKIHQLGDAFAMGLGLIGLDPKFLKVLETCQKVAATDATVLITGETGTGKEPMADAIHKLSSRRDKPFIKVNCAAFPENLLESELFGHSKGAFTGAQRDYSGRFEQSDGGTLFLDEIGDMPLPVQAKILRVLQDGEFQPVGSGRTVRVDVRVISATNKPLKEMIRANQFREDLFHRLNTIQLHLPPLRERSGDIPALAEHFRAEFVRSNSKIVPRRFSNEALTKLKSGHRWPGNVRELRNVIRRALVIAEGKDLLPEDIVFDPLDTKASVIPESLWVTLEAGETLDSLMDRVEAQIIEKTWEANGWNQANACSRSRR